MQVQNTLYMALNALFGSQPMFLFNHIQAGWADSANGLVRMGILSFTSSPVDSMNQVLQPIVFLSCSALTR